MGWWGSAGWVTRVSTFVEGGVPLNTTGNLVSHNATKICGYGRRWGRKREKVRVPENYGDRGKRTCAIYVEHLRAASLLPADYSRKETRQKDSANWKRNYNADTRFLRDVVTRSISSNVKLVWGDVASYAQYEWSSYCGLIFYVFLYNPYSSLPSVN